MGEKKKILVYGTGAVGGYFGGKLALNSDNDVRFIARSNLSKLKKNGLIVKSFKGDFKVKVKAHKSPSEVKYIPDLVILTMKSYDTNEAIEKLKGIIGKETLILSIQNGLSNYNKLLKAFGKKRVVRGFCYIGSEMLDSGIIKHTSNGFIIIGESEGISKKVIDELYRLFTESDIETRKSKDIIHDIWAKFSWNCTLNILCALIGKDTDSLFSSKETEKLTRDLYDEIRKVAKAHGVMLTKKDESNVIDKAKQYGPFKPSTLQDIQKGKMLEYEAFTGDIVRMAKSKGVLVPINNTLYGLLKAVEN